jgi:hypothetical protein
MNSHESLFRYIWFHKIFSTPAHWDLIPDRDERFTLLQNIQTGSGAQPVCNSMAIEDSLSTGVKPLGHEADDSTPSTAEVKNDSSCTFTFPPCLPGTHRDFTFFYFTV